MLYGTMRLRCKTREFIRGLIMATAVAGIAKVLIH